MRTIIPFVVGFVGGAAFYGERRWAMWALAIFALLLAAANAYVGDWLWAVALLCAAGYWSAGAIYGRLTVHGGGR